MNKVLSSITQKKRNRLSVRIVVAVLLCSSALTLLATAVQLYFDYQKDVKAIHSNIQFIQDSYLPAIISSVYTLDEKQVNTLLEGSLNIPDIEYVEIKDVSNNPFKSAGNPAASKDVTQVFPLDFITPSGKVISVGTLTVFASLEGIYHRLLEKAYVILLSNMVKTFFASILILMIINHIVVRHLVKISNFTRHLSLDELGQELTLNRKESESTKSDELAQLVQSINRMLINIKDDTGKIEDMGQSLRGSEERYRSLVENQTELLSRFTPDGTFVFVNDAYCQFFGKTKDELVGKKWHPLLVDDDLQFVQEKLQTLSPSNPTVLIENRIISGKGDIHWVQFVNSGVFDLDGNLIEVQSVGRDITERKRAEEALRESEEKYRSMMESMDDLVYICSPDYHVEYMNPAMVKKMEGRDAVGELCHKVLHELDEKCPWCVYDKVQSGENHVTEIVSPKDNRTYNVSHFPIHNADGSISKLNIYRDVTEKRKMEAQFQQATKMEAIATLAGGVAHEFNNALMGVMGNIELLKMEFSEDERREKYFEVMKSSGHRMSHLTDQLLAYAQGGKYQPRDLTLDDFVIGTLPILEHDLSSAIRVETHFPKDISYIKADNAQMQMVLSAILANSNEAIEDEGLIRITAENKDVDEALAKQHPGFKPGAYVCLIIEDDGKGMDQETKDRIFEPFFTTKFQGRGMGMAAVYGIVKNHDGWISVDSEPRKGTVVRIYLPAIIVESKEPGAKAATQPDVEPATGEGTVLMIEDQDVVIEVTQVMLERLGYRVMVAKTGKDAVHITETFDGQIDLALLDIKLPDMEGGKVYPLIMQARPDLKVIVFSGYSIDGPARGILDAGAQDFIQKPFSLAALSEKLKKVLEPKGLGKK